MYSPARVVRQFGWSERIPAVNECTNDSFDILFYMHGPLPFCLSSA